MRMIRLSNTTRRIPFSEFNKVIDNKNDNLPFSRFRLAQLNYLNNTKPIQSLAGNEDHVEMEDIQTHTENGKPQTIKDACASNVINRGMDIIKPTVSIKFTLPKEGSIKDKRPSNFYRSLGINISASPLSVLPALSGVKPNNDMGISLKDSLSSISTILKSIGRSKSRTQSLVTNSPQQNTSTLPPTINQPPNVIELSSNSSSQSQQHSSRGRFKIKVLMKLGAYNDQSYDVTYGENGTTTTTITTQKVPYLIRNSHGVFEIFYHGNRQTTTTTVTPIQSPPPPNLIGGEPHQLNIIQPA